LHTARTGETSFDHVFGMSNWEHRLQNPELNDAFNEMIARGAEWSATRAAANYDFSGIRRITDVGGGTGAFLAHLIRAKRDLRGTLFDQPHVVAGAAPVLARLGVADRCDIVGGDFFEGVPEGADAYILKNVIHDWDDERATQILRACRRVVTSGVRLLVVESVMSARILEADTRVDSDIHMMALNGGRERSEAMYRELLSASGFALARAVSLAPGISLLEARPVEA
jgi:hypothetical protein